MGMIMKTGQQGIETEGVLYREVTAQAANADPLFAAVDTNA